MKKLFVTALLLIAGSASMNAQGIDFGIKAGANFSKLDGSDVSGDNLTSFHVGALVELNLLENLSIQPEIMYSSQGTKIEDEEWKVDYISVPVLAKFYVLTDKLSLEAGPQFSFLINEDFPSSIGADVESESFDFGIVGGLGLNITNNIFAQARYVVGLTEASKEAEVTNQVIQLSVGLKF